MLLTKKNTETLIMLLQGNWNKKLSFTLNDSEEQIFKFFFSLCKISQGKNWGERGITLHYEHVLDAIKLNILSLALSTSIFRQQKNHLMLTIIKY